MFLKSLTLKGFKSFADATTLELERGVTVVVGPNGSGKSNLVDAVAWVLGAQGPRTVRSSKMDDVIFAGSPGRPALGRAEVSLTIDNSARLLPIEFSEVTITRTLFRSGDSEYAINGVPCRLLDVQELLSDTGVGRQQHVIVSQGQLASILDARPEDRRLVVEEAAGVLKYRRRREKALRRLEAGEANLVRLQDLLREVRRQLKPLERQADAARRHDALAAELRALRLHLAGRELTGLTARAEAAAARTAELAAAEAELQAELSRLDAEVAAAEAAVPDRGADEGVDAVVRFDGLRQRARGLSAVLAERRRSLERELRGTVDEGVVASLEAEAAGLSAALASAEAEAAALVPHADELAAAEAALAAERAAVDGGRDHGAGGGGDASPRRAGEHRGELVALRRSVEQARSELAGAEARAAGLEARLAELDAGAEARAAELAEAEAAERALVPAVEEAAAARVAAEAAVAAAEEALRGAEQARNGWSARADALTLALEEALVGARARTGAERLAGAQGVLGTLLDLVEVDEGWDAAFEAAAGESMAAVVVDGLPAARRALARLVSGDDRGTGGAVLALRPPSAGATTVADAVAAARARGVPAEPVLAHVRARRPEVDALLDVVLARAVAVDGGWEQAMDLAAAAPGLVVVTLAGDRFVDTGWRVGASTTGATARALDEARARLAASTADSTAASAALDPARSALAHARGAEADAVRRRETASEARAAAAARLERVRAERRDLAAEQVAVRTPLEGLAARAEADEARMVELEALLPALEADEAAAAERAAAERAARMRVEERAAAVAALRRDLEVRAGGLEERRSLLAGRLAEVEQRLARHAGERAGAEARRVGLERQVAATERLAAVVAERGVLLEAALGRARERRRRHLDAVTAAVERVDGLRRERAEAERRLVEVRELARRAELDGAEVRLRLEAAVEGVRREFDCEPEAATASPCPELPDGESAAQRARRLERELRLMGPVNPLALEEFAALQERHAFLEGQLEDVRQSRRELLKVVRAVDAEIATTFSAAFADVSEHFTRLFSTLFPGGAGRLRLTDPDNLLDTGIEVEARPSGKNVRKLSLLSGGERSLAALAFLFAVFRSRPSPFYLLDEVEAALDDVNLHRFLGLLDEFRNHAQLLVVSHQKRTMEAADCLYGVTQQPAGSSRVVSERLTARV